MCQNYIKLTKKQFVLNCLDLYKKSPIFLTYLKYVEQWDCLYIKENATHSFPIIHLFFFYLYFRWKKQDSYVDFLENKVDGSDQSSNSKFSVFVIKYHINVKCDLDY